MALGCWLIDQIAGDVSWVWTRGMDWWRMVDPEITGSIGTTGYIMSVIHIDIKLKGGWIHELEAQEVNVTRRYQLDPSLLVGSSGSHVYRWGFPEKQGGERKQRTVTFKTRGAYEIYWEGLMRGCGGLHLKGWTPKLPKVRGMDKQLTQDWVFHLFWNTSVKLLMSEVCIISAKFSFPCHCLSIHAGIHWAAGRPWWVKWSQSLWEAGTHLTFIVKYGLCNAIILYISVDIWEQCLSSFQCHPNILLRNRGQGKVCSGNAEKV